ncbi:cytochrome P450 [Aspergillus germanicus]
MEVVSHVSNATVRITPNEVHIRDPEWAPVLYAGLGHIRDKDPSLAHSAGTADGTFGTISHHIHRRRRAPAGVMSEVLRGHHERGTVVNARSTFLGWSNDTLGICSFGESQDLLHDMGKVTALIEVFKFFAAAFPILRQCGWLIPSALALPVTSIRYISKPIATLLDTHLVSVIWVFPLWFCLKCTDHGCIRYVPEYNPTRRTPHKGVQSDTSIFPEPSPVKKDHGKAGKQETLFDAILASNLPETEKRPERMAHEGFEILLAGSDTAARTMGVAIYHIVANLKIKHRLQRELRTAIPGPYDHIELRVLEQLPFLNVVLKESLRIGKITDHRLGLIAPTEALQYKEWTLPPGVKTRISMTPDRNAFDEKFFLDPDSFLPDRWLQSDEQQLAAMNRVFMPFTHGRRGCLGMHFATIELQAGLACLFRQFDFELYDTIRERDVDHTWSHAAGEPSKGSKGLRFRVTAAY